MSDTLSEKCEVDIDFTDPNWCWQQTCEKIGEEKYLFEVIVFYVITQLALPGLPSFLHYIENIYILWWSYLIQKKSK